MSQLLSPIPTLPPADAAKVFAADRVVGMMHITQLLWLFGQASRYQRILEVGSYRGRSTTALCLATPGTVTAVDTWNGSPELLEEINAFRSLSGDPDWLYHEFLHNTQGLVNLEIFRKPSIEAAAAMASADRTFDMVFLDGAHDHDSVVADIRAWFPLVEAPNGLICGHDLDHKPVHDAVCECFPNFPRHSACNMWAIYKRTPGDIL